MKDPAAITHGIYKHRVTHEGLIERRCGLFPCNANFSHVKKSNKLCRWCNKYDKIEDENHILNECNLSPISENKYIFKEMVFGNNFEEGNNFTNFILSCYQYKNILAKSCHRF